MSSTTRTVLLLLLLSVPVSAGIPFSTTPDWISVDVSMVSTGGALADLDRDGWLDLVVANGNDMARQPLAVYYNRGDGTLPALPDWTSLSTEYHGHLAAGDVDGDGWTDIAVSIFLGPAGFSEPGWVALYLNDGAGGLPSEPTWTSTERFFTFGLALGDGDGDGDLDLAVAVGEPYQNLPDRNRIFFNHDGGFAGTSDWQSDELDHNLGVAWGDADNDGDLDIAIAGTNTHHRIYFQSPAGVETTASWHSVRTAPMGDQLSFGDLDRDGYLDMAVSENDQLGGIGRFRYFPGTAAGLSETDSWQSGYAGYGAEAVIGDANGDGWPDLLCGSWGAGGVYSDQVRIYGNRYSAGLGADPDWISGTGSVNERILLGDINNDGLRWEVETFEPVDGRKLFYLRHLPFRELTAVEVDGVILGTGQYCHDRAGGWIALAEAPQERLVVAYLYSDRLDLVVTNWDPDQGNFLFYAGEPALLFAVKEHADFALRLAWTGGFPAHDILESPVAAFGPGLLVKERGLVASDWTDKPDTLDQGGLLYYKVY